MNFSVIIPNYNGIGILGKNLPHVLLAAKDPRNKIAEIIVVDDASTDGSTKYLENFGDKITLLKNRENRGFSSSINLGAEKAKGDYLVLLNSDVLPKNDFLVNASEYFQNDKLLFAISLNEKKYGPNRGVFKNGFVVHEGILPTNNSSNTFWVSGGSGIFKKNVFLLLGGMDENIFSPFYWEDVDLSYRALKRGYKILWVPDCIVSHKHEAVMSQIDSNYRQRIQQRNQLLFIWKNITSPQLFRGHLFGLSKRLLFHPGYFSILYIALIKGREVYKARYKEKKELKVSDEEIFAMFK